MKIKKKEMEIQFEGMGKIKFEKLRDKNKKSKGLPIKKAKFINTIKYNQFEKLLRNDYILSLLPRRNKIRIYETMPINLISIYISICSNSRLNGRKIRMVTNDEYR